MDWDRDLRTWPRFETSRLVESRPHRWHVQEAGDGPLILLIHGAGGSTHSWRDVIPHLAQDHRVVAIDLPGQGFSRAGSRQRLGLAHMAEDIAALCAQEGWQPAAIVGHSAGGAVALRLAGQVTGPDGAPPRVIGINAALAPFDGLAGWLFPMLAKLLVLNPLVPGLFSITSGRPDRVRQLIEGTGSTLSDEGLALYARLIGDRAHVDGTLRMMAQWDLNPLLRDLGGIDAPVTLITGDRDRAVPPRTSDAAAADLPNAKLIHLTDLGHLAHEEAPARLSGLIREALA